MRPPVWFVAIAAVIAATAALRVLGDIPPASVDGLRVMTVSEVVAARAAGGLRNQQVALGGYWSSGSLANSCNPGSGLHGELEIWCADGEYGIAERNEPILLFGRYSQGVWAAKGPHLTPYIDDELFPNVRSFWHADGTWGDPPVPIVVVGHFDDPRAADCQVAARQECLDRLVVDRIAYFNTQTAYWAPNLPTPEPTDPPTPPVYQGG